MAWAAELARDGVGTCGNAWECGGEGGQVDLLVLLIRRALLLRGETGGVCVCVCVFCLDSCLSRYAMCCSREV